MFFRVKKSGPRQYLQIVESRWEEGRSRQRVIATVGRLDELAAKGDLDRLLASGARFSEQMMLLSALEGDDGQPRLETKRIGAPLLFGRLWQETGCGEVLQEFAERRGFGFSLERAVFTTVLHRLMVSGSDRACEHWKEDYLIDGADELELQHFYRAMAWLGEALPDADQADATPFAPRCMKDAIEEALFARRRDLFTDLSVVFLDTTSLSFTGEGGEELGRRGHSKDHRPDLKQMIVGVVIDGEGRPVCSEMWPGNTADVSVLIPLIDRLRQRFALTRVCVVADRGMISEGTIAALEERGLAYILGVRERSDKQARHLVLNDDKPFTPLMIERSKGETQLFVKEAKVGERRYILCRNEAEAEKDRADRQAIVEGLEKQLKKGAKALISNTAYRRYVRSADPEQTAFEIDTGKLAEEAAFDGLFILRTNAKITPLEAVLRYRELIQVERLFQTAKAVMHTRPIYHSSDAAIRGHVFCSFLGLILRKELQNRCEAAGIKPEWDTLLHDLDRLQEATIEKDGKTWRLRTEATGTVPEVMKAARIALPPRAQRVDGQSQAAARAS